MNRLWIVTALAFVACLGFGNVARAQNTYTVVEDRGNNWTQTVTLPTFAADSRLLARLHVKSTGDPWDRHGRVTVDTPNGAVDVVKFITGFGGNYWNDPVDVTALRPLLQGEATFRGTIDQDHRWQMSLIIEEIPGGYSGDPSMWVAPVIPSSVAWSEWNNGGFDGQPWSYQVQVPEDSGRVYLTLHTSGHGSDSNGCEFSSRRHKVWVDGTQVLDVVPWRNASDALRGRNPTSGRWDGNGDGDTTDRYPTDRWSSDFARSNWLPGDTVDPFVVDVTGALSASASGDHMVEFLVEGDMGSGCWLASSYLHGTPPPPPWATVQIDINDPLVPSGLGVGDEFQLAFVTSTKRDGMSSDIADYNAFVQSAADAAGIGAGKGVTWRAIASTPTDDARDNAEVSAPVYNMAGLLVATGSADMWDGLILAPIDHTEYGELIAAGSFDPDHIYRVRTGTMGNGTARDPQCIDPAYYQAHGWTSRTNGDWIAGDNHPQGMQSPMYALSSPLVIVPEPSTLVLLVLGGLGLLARRRKGSTK